MANTLVQFRADETLRLQASNICQSLGLDLPSYLRICLARLVQSRGIPFSMNVDDIEEDRGMRALKAAWKIAEEQGTDKMTLDDINAEIAAARS